MNVYGEPVDGLRAFGGVAFIDGELVQTAGGSLDGNQAVGVPDYQIVAGAELDLPFLPVLTVSGRVIHTAGQFVDASNTQKIPNWTRLDLGARYTFEREAGKPIVLRLAVQNEFDTDYWASAASERAVNVRYHPVLESGIIKCSVFYQGFEDLMIAGFLAPTASPSLSVSRLCTAQTPLTSRP